MGRYTVEIKGFLLKDDLKRCGIKQIEASSLVHMSKNYITDAIRKNRMDKDVLKDIAKHIGTDYHRYVFAVSEDDPRIVYEQMTYEDKIRAMPTDVLLKAMRDISLELYSRKEDY